MKRIILIFFPAFICGAVLISCGSENAVPKEPQEEPHVIVPVKSSKCDILKFEDNVHHIIWEIHGTIIIGFYTGGTDLSSITPSATVSEKASVSPQSGEKMDFSNGKEITYTVTAEDGTEKVYKTQAFAPKSAERDILKFIDNEHSIIWEINGTSITATYPACTDVSSITPTVIVSAKASVSPQSGQKVDFSKEVTYTVTAEDGITKVFTAQAKVSGKASSSIIIHGTIIPENITVSDNVLFKVFACPVACVDYDGLQLNVDSIIDTKIFISGKHDTGWKCNGPIYDSINIGLFPTGMYEVIFSLIDVNYYEDSRLPIEIYNIEFIVNEK